VREDGSPYNMTGCTGTKRYMAPEVVLSKPDYDLKVYTSYLRPHALVG
jgi:hypothetical protein